MTIKRVPYVSVDIWLKSNYVSYASKYCLSKNLINELIDRLDHYYFDWSIIENKVEIDFGINIKWEFINKELNEVCWKISKHFVKKLGDIEYDGNNN